MENHTNNQPSHQPFVTSFEKLMTTTLIRFSRFKTTFQERLPGALAKTTAHFKTHKWLYAAIVLVYTLLIQQFHLGVGLTDSLPYRFYLAKRDAKFTTGDYVTYLYQGFYTDGKPRTFVKQIAGVSGDSVEVMVKNVARLKGDEVVYTDDTLVFINQTYVATVKQRSRTGRAMQALNPGVIPSGSVYLHAPHPDSFDSRYSDIGLVRHDKVTGRIIWMW